MTREDFMFIRAMVLQGITDAQERARVSAVTYEQAVMNERDGKPAFGFDPSIPKGDQKALQEKIREMVPDLNGTIH